MAEIFHLSAYRSTSQCDLEPVLRRCIHACERLTAELQRLDEAIGEREKDVRPFHEDYEVLADLKLVRALLSEMGATLAREAQKKFKALP